MGSVALGYRISRRWLAELDLTRRKNEMEIYDTRIEETRTKGSVRGDSMALNLRFAFRPDKAINPFVGLGLGAASVHYDLDWAAGREPFIRDTAGAGRFQWLLGLDRALTKRWTVTIDYRGALTEDFTVEQLDGETFVTNYLVHSFSIGARHRFASK